jgi:hypothetical protein
VQRFAGQFVGPLGAVRYGSADRWTCQRGDPYRSLFLPTLSKKLLRASERNHGIVHVRGLVAWHVRVTGFDPRASLRTKGPEVYDYFIQTGTFRLVEQTVRATTALAGGSTIAERNVLALSRYGERVNVAVPGRCRPR